MARGRLQGIPQHSVQTLDRWELTSCAPGAIDHPDGLRSLSSEWLPATVPCTVASALRAAQRWSWDDQARRFDAEDWWFRTEFFTEAVPTTEQLWLNLDGLATVADVWFNGSLLLESRGMFRRHERRIDDRLAANNSLVIRFRSLDGLLAAKRPRPRWRTPMIDHQQLRWFRTTLLGRTPGWSPPAAAVGPWRPIYLVRRGGLDAGVTLLRAEANGRLDVVVRTEPVDGSPVTEAALVLARKGQTIRVPLAAGSNPGSLEAHTQLSGVELWWPHTHGEPALYDASLEVRRGQESIKSAIGRVGFRTVTLHTSAGNFELHVNDTPIFCRGACWTPLDVVSLTADAKALDSAFAQIVDCGMNMVRLGGTMVYESDAFLDRCDASGVLLWQDFMFANMDYPDGDPEFSAEVEAEAHQLLERLQGRPAVALLCGNSEGEQQPAMWGAPRSQWEQPLFHRDLTRLAAERCPGVPYWPSSTHGGSFPHQSNAGSSSYYGVGAYLRPLDDARRAEVRFASECLAFANIPEEAALARLPTTHRLRSHHALWKARAPRDLGAGWDFDDVRDHYLQRLFGLDPVALRYADHERYLELGRVVTGEVMAATFLEWRRTRSVTRGGLVWFLRDLWPGAGWGVIDALGKPKPVWHYLRRALAPLTIGLSDEGGNGVAVHVFNDRNAAFNGTLELDLIHAGQVRVGGSRTPISLDARSSMELNAVALLEDFQDLSYAYRFGPPPHNLVAVTLRADSGAIVGRAVHFIGNWPSAREKDIGLTARAESRVDGRVNVTLTASRFAQSVHLDVAGWVAEDNYFHVLPGEVRQVTLCREPESTVGTSVRGTVRALNSESTAKVAVP